MKSRRTSRRVAAGVPPAVEGARLAARINARMSHASCRGPADAAGRDAPALRQAGRLSPRDAVPRLFGEPRKNSNHSSRCGGAKFLSRAEGLGKL